MTRPVGRPRINLNTNEIVALHKEGKSLRTLAKKYKVSYMTISDRLHRADEKNKKRAEFSVN